MEGARAMALHPTSDLPHQTLFNDTAADLLALLREQLHLRLWIVSRAKGDEWVAAVVEGQAYGIRAGHVFKWTDTLCSRMVGDKAPRFAADVNEVPAYAAAPFACEFRVGAYVGAPLCAPDGRIIGTLCAFDPLAQPAFTPADVAMVERCARILSRVMNAEARAVKQSRRLERTEAVAFCDGLTGLYNRRGWDQLLKAEESRCRRHGRTACVVSIDLDDLKVVNDSGGHDKGDDLIRRAANAIRATIRTQDVAARVGGDEFAVLAVECDPEAVLAFRERLEVGLANAGISASLGVALRTATSDLTQTWREADEAMYESKRERKSGAGVRVVSAS
jgi:diguanylate cyclase